MPGNQISNLQYKFDTCACVCVCVCMCVPFMYINYMTYIVYAAFRLEALRPGVPKIIQVKRSNCKCLGSCYREASYHNDKDYCNSPVRITPPGSEF